MNYVENSDTWRMVETAVTEFCAEHDMNEVSACTKQERQLLVEECVALAVYPSRDKGNTQISQYELFSREEKGDLFSVHLLHRLEQHFFLRELMGSCDFQAERKLLNGLFTNLPVNTYFPADKTVIGSLLEKARTFMLERITVVDAENIVAKADAAKLLRKHGVVVTLCEGSFDLTDEACKQVFAIIENLVRKASGVALMKYLYEIYMAKRYIPQMDRYILSRGNAMSDDMIDFPFRLLWDLSVKHFHKNPQCAGSEDINEAIREAVELSNAWLRTMGLHERSAMQYAMMPATQFSLRLKEELLYDKFCIPEQYCARYILFLLDHLIKPWFDQCFVAKYSYRDFRSVAASILKRAGGYREIDISALKQESKVSIRRIRMIFEDFSWQLREVNKDYDDLASETNISRRPLVKRPDGIYVSFDQHFCGIGFYLRAQELLSAKVCGLDKKQGSLLEAALRAELKTCGIPYSFGKYPEKGGINESDCDLVFEGDRVIFAEVKKSGCSQEFDIADDVGVLSRLGRGMLNAQKQCFDHERYLRQNGEIILQDANGNEHRLVLDESSLPAVKISICMSEYSFLTNKSFSKAIMESLPYVTYHSYDPSRESEFDQINNLRETILSYAHKDAHSGLIRIEELRAYTMFCSMQQILMAAWIWKNVDDFLLMIRDWRQTADLWLDPYYLLLQRIVIKENPEELSVREHALKMLQESHPEAVFIL